MLAGVDAVGPCMIELRVTGISTVLEPSAIASATAALARFLGNTALGAPVSATHHRWTRRRGGFCGNVNVKLTQEMPAPMQSSIRLCIGSLKYNARHKTQHLDNLLLQAWAPSAHV